MGARSSLLRDEPSVQDFLDVQAHFRLPSLALVEKDWRVIRALNAITAIDAGPFRLVFAGGTCLARAHRLVRRMSEDVDFKIVSIDANPVSGNKRRQQLGELRNQVTASLQAAGFPVDTADPSQLRSRDGNRYTVYHLHDVRPGRGGAPLRPTIQIELTYATLRLPSVSLPVTSFVAEAFKQPPEIQLIPCVCVTETAAEKIVSLTRRTAMELAGLSRDPDPTLVRHIYDLHMIRNHIDRPAAIDLARRVAMQDAEEFKNQYPGYHVDIVGETRKAIMALMTTQAIKERYADFVAAMVYGEQADFDTAIATSAALVDDAWPLNPSISLSPSL
jgi:predicted nucleotidyltransferase component of viral defense system